MSQPQKSKQNMTIVFFRTLVPDKTKAAIWPCSTALPESRTSSLAAAPQKQLLLLPCFCGYAVVAKALAKAAVFVLSALVPLLCYTKLDTVAPAALPDARLSLRNEMVVAQRCSRLASLLTRQNPQWYSSFTLFSFLIRFHQPVRLERDLVHSQVFLRCGGFNGLPDLGTTAQCNKVDRRDQMKKQL